MQDKFNIFVNLSSKEWTESRRIIIDIILGTDMVNHSKQISSTLVNDNCDLYIITLLTCHSISSYSCFRKSMEQRREPSARARRTR